MSKPFLDVLGGAILPTAPIWMMRQAGRYLPEYRVTRQKAGDFLNLCYNPELATEVSLQPIRRYGFDAAILFADILLIAQALGCELWFEEGKGPRLSVVQNARAINRLYASEDVHQCLSPIYKTLGNLSNELPAHVALIGFAGAPWTVASYMVAGQGTHDQAPARRMIEENPDLFECLIARLTDATITYLCAQIDAGAQVIKIFDSWAGALNGKNFERFVTAPTRLIIKALKAHDCNIPIIVFPRGAGRDYHFFAHNVGADALALDQNIDPFWAAQMIDKNVVLQGNLSPKSLILGGSRLQNDIARIKEAFTGRAHIFNLGHGVLPQTNPGHVRDMITYVRQE